MTKAGEAHMAAAKKVLRYLQSRKKIPIKWCAMGNALPGVIHGYADASFADIPDTRLSAIGYVFIVNGGAISWRSTKTPLQVLNAAEAEIVSLSSAAQECLFLRKLCIEMGFHQHRPTIIYEDCEAAVALSNETHWGSLRVSGTLFVRRLLEEQDKVLRSYFAQKGGARSQRGEGTQGRE